MCDLDKFRRFSDENLCFKSVFKVVEGQLGNSNVIDSLHIYIATELLRVPQYVSHINTVFAEEIPKLLTIHLDKREHWENCILLGKLVHIREDISSYALQYFETHPSPFSTEKKKKGRNSFVQLQLVEACYFLLKSKPDFYREKWQWSHFLRLYLNHVNLRIKWIASNCCAILMGMNSVQLEDFISKRFEPKVHINFTYKFGTNSTLLNEDEGPKIHNTNLPDSSNLNKLKIEKIAGVYLPVGQRKRVLINMLVEVASTLDNLHDLARALTGDRAILIRGPIGSGKTSIVEYLAGRLERPFIKIQLGDEIDSKTLLGTYRCTDVPGEFLWSPGILTRALENGTWLLLEDLDAANVDIAPILCSLLDNGTLTVPGYRENLRPHSGFQLFCTQRTGPSSRLLVQYQNFEIVNLRPLTDTELIEIVKINYPKFRTIADRMLRAYKLTEKSCRDFFKWLQRAGHYSDFQIDNPQCALKLLQDGIDVFCCDFADKKRVLDVAQKFAAELGILPQKAEYLCDVHVPVLNIRGKIMTLGRAHLERHLSVLGPNRIADFYFTRPTAVLLERIMCCVSGAEPVLLVGETGTGKTATVQYLADTIGRRLVVINMNQQSDTADLLGGFKPVSLKQHIGPVRREFEGLFGQYYRVDLNTTFLTHIARCYNNEKWAELLQLMSRACQAALNRLHQSQREIAQKWRHLATRLDKLEKTLKHKYTLAFRFIEGSLVKALKNGYWVLLDEINLASGETLECLSGILENAHSSICLVERGDRQPIKRHKDFTLFACMNPSTDVGKKDLPAGLRARFTEFFVPELTDENDLLLLVGRYLEAMSLDSNYLRAIVKFYLDVCQLSNLTLTDCLGHKPHYSLRSLCRALRIAAKNPCGTSKRSLYEAFCLSFLTQLDAKSYAVVQNVIHRYIIEDKGQLNQPIPKPSIGDYVNFEGYWVEKGDLECNPPAGYILTQTVRKNLHDLVRIVSIGRLPVLIQGETSVGKTSLITYLAQSSGNHCIRINNHEHTDLQEYIGSYVADQSGKLVFREGPLPRAMRAGHWLILDELNLAPSDVLEALNRVLDDNRELFVPETQETIRAHKRFLLFATQNPPGHYGGRKLLSRAFRNRFVELHFSELPPKEIEQILHEKCAVPQSYAVRMVSVLRELQKRRCQSAAFAGKHGFMTLRDLFRWAERYRNAPKFEENRFYDWNRHLADEGYLVLAGRMRKPDEKREISEVLSKIFKCQIESDNLFNLNETTSPVTRPVLEELYRNSGKFPAIEWTENMRHLAVLFAKCLQFHEPVLLVGDTGCGKTTICQIIAQILQQSFVTVNCHMHTESSDFIGGLRPVRDHTKSDDNRLFEWVNGPLIQAMVEGAVFLLDEISLADDSVLERLNSLLEPERSLLLVEKGVDLNQSINHQDLVVAHAQFHFVATMNPGGDFGKKELSPALRNRFTEIWCDSCMNPDDLNAILVRNLKCATLAPNIVKFWEFLRNHPIGKRIKVTVRDLLTWAEFINTVHGQIGEFPAYFHGAHLVVLDSLGCGSTILNDFVDFRRECVNILMGQTSGIMDNYPDILKCICDSTKFGVEPFYVKTGSYKCDFIEKYEFNCPTVINNTMRILRGMQLNKAILLEGSPGVGKTSLVCAIARHTQHHVFRVNLSDQTDISDLFGADLPVEGGRSGQFAWRDGPLLQALKNGSWILLDELNLASQSVLEGLNPCLDHRGEVYIPELGRTFKIPLETRFFACQNPLKQGGFRRGLPQSFLNRFIQVYVQDMQPNDYEMILQDHFHDELPAELLNQMIRFNEMIQVGDWEFNLRDLLRWGEFMVRMRDLRPENSVNLIYMDRMRYISDQQRIRDSFEAVFHVVLSKRKPIFHLTNNHLFLGDLKVERFVSDRINRNVYHQYKGRFVLNCQLSYLRSVAYCVEMNWLCILVGNSGCGKNSIVRTLAQLTGHNLVTLPVTSSMDSNDILGGFEQTNYNRHLEAVMRRTEELLQQTVIELLLVNCHRSDVTVIALYDKWEEFLKLTVSIGDKSSSKEEITDINRKLDKLQEFWTELINYANVTEQVQKLQESVKLIEEKLKNSSGGTFEWVDSTLIKCLKEGDWLLVDNVNLCSAAVLDRLNSLVEPKGSLLLTERGCNPQTGKLHEIHPHPNFRLFFTMDPKNGPISRAMRNRGLEIYLENQPLIDDHPLNTANLHFNPSDALIRQQLIPIDENLQQLPLISFLIMTFYTLTITGTDRDQRNFYILNRLNSENLEKLCRKLNTYLSTQDLHVLTDFPVDSQWLGRIITPELILNMYQIVQMSLERKFTDNAQKKFQELGQFSLLSYVRHFGHTTETFGGQLTQNFTNLIRCYDDFIGRAFSTITTDNFGQFLVLFYWRRVFFAATLVNLRNLPDGLQRQHIERNFWLHFHWFRKYAINGVTNLCNLKLTDELQCILNGLHLEQGNSNDNMYKFSRNFAKHSKLPRPNIEEAEYVQKLYYETKISCLLSPIDKCSQPLKLLKYFKDHPEVRGQLLNRELCEIPDLVDDLGKIDYEIVPFVDYFAFLHMKRDNIHLLRHCISVPVNMFIARSTYELNRTKYMYFLNAPCIKTEPYLDQRDLSQNGPLLTNALLPVIINTARGIYTPLGIFKSVQKQRQFINNAIWMNRDLIFEESLNYLENEVGVLKSRFEEFLELVNLTTGGGDLKEATSEIFVEFFTRSEENYRKLCHLKTPQVELISAIYMDMGFLKFWLYSRLPLIDPVLKRILKRTHYREIRENLENFAENYRIFSVKIFSGTSHPYVEILEAAIGQLKQQEEKLGKSNVYRPENFTYDTVLNGIAYIFRTILSPDYVRKIGSNTVLKEVESDKMTLENFVHDWRQFSAAFPDLIEPILCSIMEFLYGLQMKIALLEQHQFRINFKRDSVHFQCNYMEIGPGKLIEKYADCQNFKLLKCTIQDSFKNCVLDLQFSSGSKTNLNHFRQMLEQFVIIWNRQQEELEQKKRESENLYKIKTKCDEPSEEEQLQAEFNEIFPQNQDFPEFDESSSLTDATPMEVTNDITLSIEDLSFMSQTHCDLVKSCARTEWLAPSMNPDFTTNHNVKVLMEKCKVFRQLYEKIAVDLNRDVDAILLDTFLILSAHNNYNDSGSSMTDFYRDANVNQVSPSIDILDELKSKIIELDEQFPEHPTLQSIMTIIDRIMTFDVCSPVTRFLTGFELLLGKCHEWEQMAHSGVSLMTLTQQLTQQIVSWRCLELSGWRHVLDTTFITLQRPKAKWWLHMYNIYVQFANGQNSKRQDLIDLLQKFVISSNLGEFEMRLDLLYTFHCHSIIFQKENEFSTILWNIWSYFRQFSDEIRTAIATERKPIEKKLKDYVKIVRWKDVNYWAIKQTVEKSHKTLFKYMREFRKILEKPVGSYLVHKPTLEKKTKSFNYNIDLSIYLSYSNGAKKLRHLCDLVYLRTDYRTMVPDINGFVKAIIDTYQSLTSYEIDNALPLEKRRSKAKYILRRKQRELASLFENLTLIGISYKAGLLNEKFIQSTQFVGTKPIDLNATYRHFSYNLTVNEDLLKIWSNCEEYYYKALCRVDFLDTALKTPAPDLGVRNVERCKGYSLSLMKTMQDQKRCLVKKTRQIYRLEYNTKQLSNLIKGQKPLIPQEQLKTFQLILKNVKNSCENLQMVLESCPEENSIGLEMIPNENRTGFWRNDPKWTQIQSKLDDLTHFVDNLNAKCQKSIGYAPVSDQDLNPLELCPFDDFSNDLNHVLVKIRDLNEIFTAQKYLITQENDLNRLLDDFNVWTLTESDSQHDRLLIRRLRTKIKLAIQRVYNNYDNCDYNNEDNFGLDVDDDSKPNNDHFFMLSDRHLTMRLGLKLNYDVRCLNLATIVKEFDSVTTSVIFTKNPEPIKNDLKRLLPILEQYLLMTQFFLNHMLIVYRTTCKLASIVVKIFIDLVSKGFCTPPDLTDDTVNDNNDGKSSNVNQDQDGVGGGFSHDKDGSNCKDVSEQIEDEDELDYPKNDQSSDRSNASAETDEENAIDMNENDEDEYDQGREMKEEDQRESDLEDEMDQDTNEYDQKLDQRIWGSDDEASEDEEPLDEDTSGKGEPEKADPEFGPKNDSETQQESKDNKQFENDDNDDLDEDQQVDPYHQDQYDLPEPEPMNLDQMDFNDNDKMSVSSEENETEEAEENPFDLDTKKAEEEPTANEEDNTEETFRTVENSDDVDEENVENEDVVGLKDDRDFNTENQDQQAASSSKNDEEETTDINTTGYSQSEDRNNGDSTSKNPEEHSENAENDENLDSKKNRKRKPGQVDTERSLADTVEKPEQKRMCTVDDLQENNRKDSCTKEDFAHITDDTVTDEDQQALDGATEEQIKEQSAPYVNNEESPEIDQDSDEEQILRQETNKKTTISSKLQKAQEEIEADEPQDDEEKTKIETQGAQRAPQSFFNTNLDVLKQLHLWNDDDKLVDVIRSEVECQLSISNRTLSECEAIWSRVNAVTHPLAQALCEQLRLILEPTQMSRLRGDYRTGRRLNMRKIIPYIASQFRKDKIWLRRTKPSKRNYQIILALDDSGSMADCHAQELTFESVAVISRALTLLESGQLGVVSFGQSTVIRHALEEPFTEQAGIGLVHDLEFNQKKTDIGALVDFVTDTFLNCNQQRAPQVLINNAKLLVILSDGRGVFSEGELKVRNAVRRAQLANIFMVFIIIDHPENQNSILDIRMFKNGRLLTETYMDQFPFSFYIVLKDINQLPNVISDALRQWFEVVSNLDTK